MDTEWDLTGNELMQRRIDGRGAAFQSLRVSSGDVLSLHYYDLLAWAIASSGPRNLLLLGLAGATTLQLLRIWGVTPQCTAVEIDPEGTAKARAAGWLAYPALSVVHDDARAYLSRPADERFSALAVDLYDASGLLEDVFSPSLLTAMLQRLEPDGILILHCLDHGLSAGLHNLRPALQRAPASADAREWPPSASLTVAVARTLQQLGLHVAAYPLWTSAALIAARSPTTLNRLAAGPQAASPSAQMPLAWLTRWLTARALDLPTLLLRYAPQPPPWSYAAIAEAGARDMRTLARSVQGAERALIESLFDLDPADLKQRPQKLRHASTPTRSSAPVFGESRPGRLLAVTPAAIAGIAALVATTSLPRGKTPELAAVAAQLDMLLQLDTANPSLAYLRSFVAAWMNEWQRGIDVLANVPSLAEILTW